MERKLPGKVFQKVGYNLACVAWRFWLGALSNKGGRGQRNRSCARLDKTAMLRRLGITREVVLLFGNFGKCCSFRYWKLPKIQTRRFG